MKIRELIESPYLVPQIYTPERNASLAYSDSSMSREFKTLYSESINGKQYDYSIKLDKTKAVVTIPATNENSESLNKILVDLELREPMEPIPLSNLVQVVTVSADNSIAGLGLTSSLYIILAKKDYSVVSDLVQFLGGQGLWKKIARNSASVGLRVRLWNLEINDWVKTQNGTEISYDTKNLSDGEVWKNFEDIIHELSNRKTSLLVLSK